VPSHWPFQWPWAINVGLWAVWNLPACTGAQAQVSWTEGTGTRPPGVGSSSSIRVQR
jgi:hypothetical protein